MDENNNGPVPGIIGQDISSEPAVSSINNSSDEGKIFDSSSFTGTEPESLVLNGDQANGGQKKPKGENIFTKWQLWAITSGVIAVAAVVAVFVTMGVYEGKLANANAVASFDSAASDLEKEKITFDEQFAKMTYEAYDTSSTYKSSTVIFPTEDQIQSAKMNCLGKFGISEDDYNYVNNLKTGDELLKSGQNVVEAKERMARIVSNYNSANTTMSNCHETILEPIMNQIVIKMGKITSNPYNDTYVEFSQPITITYKGDREIETLELEYDLLDRNGVSVKSRSATYRYTKNDNQRIKKGDTVTIDLYKDSSYQYRVKSDSANEEMKYKPVLKSISGYYKYEYK